MLVTGIKFVQAEKKFVARVQYTDANGGDMKRYIQVSEEWVPIEEGFPDDVINHVLALDSHQGFFSIPADMQVKVENKTITRVKFHQKVRFVHGHNLLINLLCFNQTW
jgi:hypothetical protein